MLDATSYSASYIINVKEVVANFKESWKRQQVDSSQNKNRKYHESFSVNDSSEIELVDDECDPRRAKRRERKINNSKLQKISI